MPSKRRVWQITIFQTQKKPRNFQFWQYIKDITTEEIYKKNEVKSVPNPVVDIETNIPFLSPSCPEIPALANSANEQKNNINCISNVPSAS